MDHNMCDSEEQKSVSFKELQSSLKELKEIYASMQQRLKDLEELAEYEDIINEAMEWVYKHCEVDSNSNFKVGDTVYTWITFLKYIVTNNISLHNLKPNLN